MASDHAQAHREVEIEPVHLANDLGWEAMAGVGVRTVCHPARLPIAQPSSKPLVANLTVPLADPAPLRWAGQCDPIQYGRAGTKMR